MPELPPRRVLAGFAVLTVLMGLNFVAVRFSNLELAPTWGAALRFAVAGVVLAGVVAVRGLPWPKGRALVGALVFGLLMFALFFGLVYWGLVEVPAGTAVVLFATVPLLTLFVAVAMRVERFDAWALVGAVLVVAGVAYLVGAPGTQGASLSRFLAVLAACLAAAVGGVVVKWFPPSHPVAMNAVGMIAACLALLPVSWLQGDAWVLPSDRTTWYAVAYLVASSLVLFPLVVWVIQHWTASATSYTGVLAPLVTIPVAAWLLGESVGARFGVAALIILAGVYVGALRRPVRVTEAPVAP